MRALPLLLFLLGAPSLGQDAPETQEAPAPRLPAPLIDASTGATSRYLPLRFTSHASHAQRYACTECHHEPSATPDQGCTSCHARPEVRLDPVGAHHQICRGCHARQPQPSAAPTTCLGCHQERP